jgi:hypothetical protein
MAMAVRECCGRGERERRSAIVFAAVNIERREKSSTGAFVESLRENDSRKRTKRSTCSKVVCIQTFFIVVLSAFLAFFVRHFRVLESFSLENRLIIEIIDDASFDLIVTSH